MYAGCPIVWKSQLQTEVALSTTEAEYTGLSYALREAIPLMQLLEEMKELGFPVTEPKAKVHCKVFEILCVFRLTDTSLLRVRPLQALVLIDVLRWDFFEQFLIDEVEELSLSERLNLVVCCDVNEVCDAFVIGVDVVHAASEEETAVFRI